MATKIIKFTKLDGSPYTGSISFSNSLRYARDSAGSNMLSQCSALDLGGGEVQVTMPDATDSYGVGFLVVPSTQNLDIKPRAQFVSNGPFVWLYGSTEANALPNAAIGPSAVSFVATQGGSSQTLTAVGGGSIVDAGNNPLFAVLRVALPNNGVWTWTATSTGATQVYPKLGSLNVAEVAVPDPAPGTRSKIIRFTNADGNPYTGPALTFDPNLVYNRNQAAQVIDDQVARYYLGGGYVRVDLPATDSVGACSLVAISPSIANVFPRAQLVADGPCTWVYASTAADRAPNQHMTNSMATVTATSLTGTVQVLTPAGAGFIRDAQGTDLFSVVRFPMPDMNSWNFLVVKTGATETYPKADSRDLRTRIVYPSSAAQKVRWSGDFSTGDWSQWSSNRHYGDQVNGVSTLPDGIDDRLLIQQHETYRPATKYGLLAHPKYGDTHSGVNTRAEVVARSTSPKKLPADNWFYEGDEVWVSWASKLAPDWEFHSRWHVISQAHQEIEAPHDNGGPMIAFTIHGNQLGFAVMNGYYDSIGEGPAAYKYRTTIRPGFWNHFLLHIKWSTNPSVGFVNLWLNGVEVVPKLMHDTLDVDGIAYWKLGLYRESIITQQQTVFHSDFNVYNSDPRIEGEEPDPDPDPDPEPEPVTELIVDSIQPPLAGPIAHDSAVSFAVNLFNATTFKPTTTITATFPTGAVETVYNGTAFLAPYLAGSGAASAGPGRLLVTLRRDGGWPGSPRITITPPPVGA